MEGDTGEVQMVRCTAWTGAPNDPAAWAADPAVLAVDVVDLDRLHLLAERGIPVERPAWSMLVWSVPGWPPTGVSPSHESPLLDLVLTRHLAWGNPDLLTSDAAVLMVSLVAPAAELDNPTFVGRYRAHREVAWVHHGFAAYRQNVVIDGATSGGGVPAAVSEILLLSADDWRDRFYVGDDSAAAVAADVAGFLDRRTTTSTLVRRIVGERSAMLAGWEE